jgi:hypothetical protein
LPALAGVENRLNVAQTRRLLDVTGRETVERIALHGACRDSKERAACYLHRHFTREVHRSVAGAGLVGRADVANACTRTCAHAHAHTHASAERHEQWRTISLRARSQELIVMTNDAVIQRAPRDAVSM